MKETPTSAVDYPCPLFLSFSFFEIQSHAVQSIPPLVGLRHQNRPTISGLGLLGCG
jgi:hypothetical protein